MKRKELVATINCIENNSDMEKRLLDRCYHINHKSNFITIPRKTFAVVCSLLVVCFSVTAYTVASGLMTMKLPDHNFADNTNYIVELQKNVIELKPDVNDQISQLYTAFSHDPQNVKMFNSFSESEKFLAVNLMDNKLFQNSMDSISLEIYGDKKEANRIKLVSYQSTKEYPTPFPVSAEFALNDDGNHSKIIASSSGSDKKTTLKTYCSKINGITAQIAVIDDKDTKSYDTEVYFVESDVLYHFWLSSDDGTSVKELMEMAQNIIDGFIE